ncbi:hypothetical protein C494_11765 [Natronorubrum bangense JCM 10635]|uniref:Uncharacterized protein n=2 Tax=Natronorubrum bangense TaxID=61858 RepID=L9WEF4_9EURY|nr:hypothetical protein C494_11765 [Natronorubrum bangense JCM 10635]
MAFDHASVGSRFIDLEEDIRGMGQTRQTRRRLLQMTGAMASMAVLAGCGDPDEEEEEEPDEEEPDEEEPDEEEPDEEEPDEEEPDEEEEPDDEEET